MKDSGHDPKVAIMPLFLPTLIRFSKSGVYIVSANKGKTRRKNQKQHALSVLEV